MYGARHGRSLLQMSGLMGLEHVMKIAIERKEADDFSFVGKKVVACKIFNHPHGPVDNFKFYGVKKIRLV